MTYITYKDLISRYGMRMAYSALTIIENSAKVKKSHILAFDCEARLRSALDAMCEKGLTA